jgi:ClpP class serine protease
MPMNNAVLARIANQQVLVAAGQDAWLNQCLMQLATAVANIEERMLEPRAENVVASAKPTTDNEDGFWPAEDDWLSYYRPYNVKDGTLQVPVQGMLVHGMPYAIGTWATGYPYIRRAISRGMADPRVRRIALVINSGGGEVAGNFDMVDWVFTQRGVKPMWAIVDEHAYSAAYSIASVADRIVVARTGGVGSIGVLTAWVGIGKALEKQGIEVQLIHAGKHKVDGNPYEALSDAVKARIQARIDNLYGIFTATVARNLGMDEAKIRETEALTYGATEAVELGLAHEVLPFDEAMAAFSRAPLTTTGVTTMELTQAELDSQLASARAQGHAAGKAEGEQGQAAAVAAAKAEGVSEERARMNGILAHAEAEKRPNQAKMLATKTSMSVEEAGEVLSASPEEAKATAPTKPRADNAFVAAMGKDNPELGEGGDANAEDDQDTPKDLVAEFRSLTGAK